LRRPSFVLIQAHALGFGEIGCYGQQKIKTPNLDALAARGMRFTSCYAGSSVPVPSRAALLTGLHTGHSPIRDESQKPLTREDTTIAESLWRYGYQTAAIGVWGLGREGTSGEPHKKGFDEWLGFLDPSQAQNAYPEWLWRNGKRLLLAENTNGHKGLFAPDLFTRAATNFIRSHRTDTFFLYVAYPLPYLSTSQTNTHGLDLTPNPYAKENWPQPEKDRAAMITRLDIEVGKILSALWQFNLQGNTVVFFTSDTGPAVQGESDSALFQKTGLFRGGKGQLYEGGLRVPMIVSWPGVIPSKSVSDFPWAFWDFMYTVAQISEVTRPDGLDGLSILPTLLGKEQKPHDFFYWEIHENSFQQAIRMDNWKALRQKPDQAIELYHLKNDPSEKTNVAAAHPDRVVQMEHLLKTARIEPARDKPKR